MQFGTKVIAGAAALASMAHVSAAPVTTSPVDDHTPPTGNFYLKTVVPDIETADAGQKEFDGLFVAPYHIGKQDVNRLRSMNLT